MTLNDLFSYHTDERKYSEAKMWLKNNNLLTKEVRRMCDELALLLTPEYYVWGSSLPLCLTCGGEDEAWYVPRPRRNESTYGFNSRLRSWLNLFVAFNTRHDENGWHTPTNFQIFTPHDDDEE